MSDTIIAGGTTYTGVSGIKATDSNDNTLTFIRPSGTKSITQNGTGIDVTEYAAVDVNVSGGGITPLKTISISQDVRSVYVDLSDLESLPSYIVKFDLDLQIIDWLHYSTTDLTGGAYDSASLSVHFPSVIYVDSTSWQIWLPNYINTSSGKKIAVPFSDGGYYIYTEKENNVILSGGTIKIYDPGDF